MIIEKTNTELTLDTSTLLGGTADVFAPYVQTANFYSSFTAGLEASLYWVEDGSTTIYETQGSLYI